MSIGKTLGSPLRIAHLNIKLLTKTDHYFGKSDWILIRYQEMFCAGSFA